MATGREVTEGEEEESRPPARYVTTWRDEGAGKGERDGDTPVPNGLLICETLQNFFISSHRTAGPEPRPEAVG